MNPIERFLRYVRYDTTSDPHAPEEKYPSTEKQLILLEVLKNELTALGLTAEMDEYGYVTATLPANIDGAPTLGFLAHVDTSPAVSGANVNPHIITYKGGDILLDDAGEYKIPLSENPELAHYEGKELIVTDGTTLLGADDKAGVAEIMSMLAHFVQHPEIPTAPLRSPSPPTKK